MICHSQIATDRPLIKQVTDYSEKGIEIPWQRVYGFTREAHVRFNHAPHIRASVDCATCHGDVAKQTRRRAFRRSQHGVLRELSPREKGVERLPHMPF